MPRLLMRAGTDPGKEFPLPETGDLKLGRLPGLWVTLDDAKVSREHCHVFKQSTGWIVEDLGSRNGTYVNAQRVRKRLLQPGDRLRIGQSEFEYSSAAPGAPDAGAAPSGGAGVPPLRPKRSARDAR